MVAHGRWSFTRGSSIRLLLRTFLVFWEGLEEHGSLTVLYGAWRKNAFSLQEDVFNRWIP